MTISARPNSNFNDWVTSLAIDSSGIIYAGAYSNGDGIFISSDGGNNWRHTKMRYGVTSMTLAKNNTIVAFAYGSSFGNYLFRLSGGGTVLDSVVLGFTPASITASRDGSLFATTYDHGIFESTDNGLHWTVMSNGLDSTAILSPIAITQNGIVAVVVDRWIMCSSDSGKSWYRGLGIHDSASVKQIIASADGTIYAAAYEAMWINANEIYASSDSGKTWPLLAVTRADIAAMAPDSGIGLYIGGAQGVYRIANTGDTTFLGLGGIAVNGLGVTSLMTYGKETIFAGAIGGVYKSTNAGESWTLLNNGMVTDTSGGNFTNSLPFGYQISCGLVDNNKGYFAGTDSAGVFRSIDGGKTWVQTGLNVPGVTAICQSTSGALVAGTLNSGLLVSSDDGTSWSPITMLVTGRKFYALCPQAIRISDNGIDSVKMDMYRIVHLGTDVGLYDLWEDMPNHVLPTGDLANDPVSAITVLPTQEGVASTPSGQVYLSPGGWTEWVHKGNVGEQVRSMSSSDSGIIFAAGPNGVYRSTDKGMSWKQMNAGITDTDLVSSTAVKGGGIFVGSFNTGDIYESTNQGMSWTIFATLGYPVRSLFIDQDNYLYASSAARIFKSSSAVTSVSQNAQTMPRSFSLYQNFPNPFNPSTVISYQLPVNSVVTLKVYDILGRLVSTLVEDRQTAGNHSVTFNAGNLSSGVYFYRLSAGSFVQTKKLTLLK